ncbi:MAG: radical SAM protein [Sedimentisphaerales bacterium]|nr:radical SAM protein [Sedimentisphaerales bacterium]
MTNKRKYLYGPVPSRRLGLSCGIDIVPLKVCTLNCIYCQLGTTVQTTVERKEYIPIEPVLAELREALAEGLEADYITLAGSGEPTLNSRLGELIDGIKKLTDIPVAILTNGTLLYREDVRADCVKADVVMPSLDAGDEQTFQKINRPNGIISIKKLISGLCTFRKEFMGQLWLEVFFIEGINTDAEHIAKIKKTIELINPDKVHLNTAVRPTAVPNISRLSAEKLQEIAYQLGPKCEVVADWSPTHRRQRKSSITEDTLRYQSVTNSKAESLLSMLKRRPCSLNDICAGLGITQDEARKHISDFQHGGVIRSDEIDGIVFFKAIS